VRRFRFRLETLLRVAIARRDAARRELLERTAFLARCEEKERRLRDESRASARYRDTGLEAGITAEELRRGEARRDALSALAGQALRDRERAERQREACLGALAAQNRRVRTLLELRARARRRFVRGEERREQKAADELYALRHIRGETPS
jgi:flagellar export protein FliJ